MLARLLSAKAAILVGSLVVATGAAAAASGSFPGTSSSHGSLMAASSTGHPAVTIGANAFGLCTAYTSVSKNFTDTSNPALTHSSAFQALQAAAAAAQGESVQSYCAAVTTTTTSAASNLSTSSAGKSGSGGPSIGANAFGLCTAYAAVSKDFTDMSNPALTSSMAFKALATAAGGASGVQAYCAAVKPPSSTNAGGGAKGDQGGSGSQSGSHPQGKPADPGSQGSSHSAGHGKPSDPGSQGSSHSSGHGQSSGHGRA